MLHDLPNVDSLPTVTISRILGGSLLKLNLARLVLEKYNRSQVNSDRRAVAHCLMAEGVGRNLIYIDGCGFHVRTARMLSQSRKGSRAVRILEG